MWDTFQSRRESWWETVMKLGKRTPAAGMSRAPESVHAPVVLAHADDEGTRSIANFSVEDRCPSSAATPTQPAIDSATLLRLALAFSAPRSNAMYIDSNNKAEGFDSIEVAVETGRAFCTVPDERILVIDQDDERDLDALLTFHREVKAQRLPPVLWQTGSPGHHHLDVRIDDPQTRKRWAERAKELGLGVRVGEGGRTRPPLTPHRRGLSVQLLNPEDPVEAAYRLSPPPPRRRRTRRLPPRIQTLLTEGGTEEEYPHPEGGVDRSKVMFSILLSALQAGMEKDAVFGLLRDPTHAGGARLQCDRDGVEKSKEEAQDDFDRSWGNAEARVRANPPRSTYRSVRSDIDGILDVARHHLRGRTSGTDLAILDAFARVGRLGNTLEIGASIRRLAELACISGHRTVRASLYRLRASGWLREKTKGHGRHAAVYVMTVPSSVVSKVTHYTLSPPLGGDESSNGAVMRHGERAAFMRSWNGHRGLGKPPWRVLNCLLQVGPITKADLVRQMSTENMARATVYRAVKKLLVWKIIEADEKGILFGPSDVEARLERFEQEVGLDTAKEQQRERHEEERIAYRHESGRDRQREKLARWEAGMAAAAGPVPQFPRSRAAVGTEPGPTA